MMKKAIFNNLSDRYTGSGGNHLLDCTVLDPRFHSLPHLTEDQRQDVFQRVKEKAVQMHNQVFILLSITNSSTSVDFALRPGLCFILIFILFFVLVVVSFFLCFFFVSFPFLLLFFFFCFYWLICFSDFVLEGSILYKPFGIVFLSCTIICLYIMKHIYTYIVF